jgi:secreted PhoX family phosphatase
VSVRARRISRRGLLGHGSTVAAAALVGCDAIGRAAGCRSEPPPPPPSTTAPAPAQALRRDPRGILDLPDGFSYRVLQRFGESMSDGYQVPGRPDAMACFAQPDGTLALLRNHELTSLHRAYGPSGAGKPVPREAYDRAAPGGVTRLVLDPATLDVRRSNLVLAGTYWNCAGGVSPWGWLSCEETLDDGHGYVFLCRTDAEQVQPPRRIASYGRFRHEAAAVHEGTLVAYLTEDEWDAALYRFVPSAPSAPFEGRLQALRLAGGRDPDTGPLVAGAALPVDWVDIDDPEGARASVREQARARGAAVVRRGEGLWIAGDDVYFCATAGGPHERGQVFRLALGQPDTLHVLAAADESDALDMPDNVCVAPNGSVYVAEDGASGNWLRRITARGEVLPFARNALGAGELAGVCFSPDGGTLFVNLQADQMTLAIRGPFDTLVPGERAEREPPPARRASLAAAFGAIAHAFVAHRIGP